MKSYPKPGPMGGTLIRKVISTLREVTDLPVKGKILMACSGGVDSTAMAVLLLKYGRRILQAGDVTLLHFDHGWRKETVQERIFVQELAEKFGANFLAIDLKRPSDQENWELQAREQRQKHYLNCAGRGREFRTVFTAHHRDDIAETNLWRILRGQWKTHRDGIRLKDGPMMRPLLDLRKKDLITFLQEEQITAFEDLSNQDTRFFRGLVREKVFPALSSSGFDPVEGFAGLSRPKK